MSGTETKPYNPCLTKQIYSYLRHGGSPGSSHSSLDKVGINDSLSDKKLELERQYYEYDSQSGRVVLCDIETICSTYSQCCAWDVV